MKFIDEFRDPVVAAQLVSRIKTTASQPWVIMEVCGGQTHSLLRHGIDAELQGTIELIHGPGCPVCVTDIRAIDEAIRLSFLPDVVLISFADMLRVPGSKDSLQSARAAGANVETVYSPLDAVRYAVTHSARQVVFFAVGFETTAPATALAILQAQQLGLKNFSVLVSHVRVQPAMEAMMELPDNRVQGFLAAGHVCCVTGFAAYDEFSRRYKVPVVVTGFEPADLLQGILECVTQLESGSFAVANCYGRSVGRDGNPAAQKVVESVYEIDDLVWRGLGVIHAGGYRLRQEFEHLDAVRRFEFTNSPVAVTPVPSALPDHRCRAGEVLTGRLSPCACEEFGRGCTPDSPLGSPMVSSEGACAAYYRYHGAAAANTKESDTLLRSLP